MLAILGILVYIVLGSAAVFAATIMADRFELSELQDGLEEGAWVGIGLFWPVALVAGLFYMAYKLPEILRDRRGG